MKEMLKDLFYGPGNEHLEIGRVCAGLGILILSVVVAWDIYLGAPIDVGPQGIGGGIGCVLLGAAVLIYVKDKIVAVLKELLK